MEVQNLPEVTRPTARRPSKDGTLLRPVGRKPSKDAALLRPTHGRAEEEGTRLEVTRPPGRKPTTSQALRRRAERLHSNNPASNSTVERSPLPCAFGSTAPGAFPRHVPIETDYGENSQRGAVLPPLQQEVKLVLKWDELLYNLEAGERAIRCTCCASAQIQMDDVQAVAKMLKGRNCKLQHFELKSVQLGSDAARALASGLRENLCLQYLGLERTNLNNEAAKAFADVLRRPGNHISHLNLSRNVIGDDGSAAIAFALQSNHCLRQLNLASCGIGSEGGRQLASALRSNRTLEILDLASNNLKEVGCEIAYSLPFSAIRSIDVSHNNLPPEAILAVEAAGTLSPEVWQSLNLAAALQETRHWKDKIPAEVWKSLRIGETMKTYLEAVETMWREHGKDLERDTGTDILASLHAPLAVCFDANGPHFEPERLQRLAHMCVPQNRASLLQTQTGRMPVHDLLVLNLTPFDITLQTTLGKASLTSRSSGLVEGLVSTRPRRVEVGPLLQSSSARTRQAYATPFSSSSARGPGCENLMRLGSGIGSIDGPGMEPHTPSYSSRRASSSGYERLKVQMELQSHNEANRPWLPQVVEMLSIDQGLGERRYLLRSTSAEGAGEHHQGAGELRCLYSVKDCSDKRTGLVAHACMVTLIWSPPPQLRGVPLQDLKSYWQRQKAVLRQSRCALTEDSNMYHAVKHAVRPSTAAAQSSLAELLDFGPAETFVSHWWGSKVDSTLEALDKHCNGRDSVRVWICSVANNQRRISEELGVNIEQSSFSLALHSPSCKAMALMLDDGCETLKRIWCLYEVLCVILMRDNHESTRGWDSDDEPPIEFDLCTPQGILNHGTLHAKAMEIAGLVSAIDVKNANCSNPHDKALIDVAIKTELSYGYEEMNCRIREAVDQSLVKTQEICQAQIHKMRTDLFSSTEINLSSRWRLAQQAVSDSHGTLNAGELLAKEREKVKQLEDDNSKLREQVKMLQLRQDGNLQLRQENANMKERLRKLGKSQVKWN